MASTSWTKIKREIVIPMQTPYQHFANFLGVNNEMILAKTTFIYDLVFDW